MTPLFELQDWQMWATFALIVWIVALYCFEQIPMEATAGVAFASLLLMFHMFPVETANGTFDDQDIFGGFASPALITIMALLIIGQAMFQTGALEAPARLLSNSATRAPRLTLGAVFAVVFVISAFLNNTPVVVMFIPVVAAIAGRMNRAASSVMIPLSYVCILAGMTTLIGSSTNLLVADTFARSSTQALGFFTQTPMGLLLAGAGLVYMMVVMPRLLPARPTLEADFSGDGRQFIAQIEVAPDSPLVGKSSNAGRFADLADMTVRLIQRGEHAFLPPFDSVVLRPGDLVVVASTRKALSALLSSRPRLLESVLRTGEFEEAEDGAAELMLVEAVVAPGSRVIGRTIEQAGVRHMTGCVALGVQRRSRMIRARMSDIRLEAGDVLLLMGPRSAIKTLRAMRDLLPLDRSRTDIPDLRRAQRARVIFLAVVLVASTELMPIAHAAVIGAMAMLAAGCLNVRQAARALDLRIFLLIGSAFALGGAMEATGGADYLARLVVGAAEPYGTLAILSALFFVVAVLTNILSNSATAILFSPIAVGAAQSIGADPTPFVLTVIFAANCSFATPIAYQTNLLVMGPGHYRFVDFVRAGAPLVFVLWVVFTITAPWLFQL